MQKHSAIILAGGKSRRFGRDKSLLRLGPELLLEKSLAQWGDLFAEIIIVSESGHKFSLPNVREVRDIFQGRGPLAGIHAGLLASGQPWSLVVACDMPLLTRDFIISLLGVARQDATIICPRHQGKAEPLCALYHRDCLPLAEQLLAAGENSVMELLCRAKLGWLDTEDYFFNLNYQEDLPVLAGQKPCLSRHYKRKYRAAHGQTTGLPLIDKPALLLGRSQASADEGSVRTYSQRLFALSEGELAELIRAEEAAPWGGYWRRGFFSAREEHGRLTESRYQAAGLDVGALMRRAGWSEQECTGLVCFAAEQYRALVANPAAERYYFDKDGQSSATPALLAFAACRLDQEGRGEPRPHGSLYPKLFFGQKHQGELNQCSFVRDVRLLQPANLPAALAVYRGSKIWRSYSLGELFLLPLETRLYEVEGRQYECYGVDLALLLQKAGLKPQNCRLKTAGGRELLLDLVMPGDYLLASYSLLLPGGQPPQNSTDLKLYGADLQLDDLVSLSLPEPGRPQAVRPQAALPGKRPWQKGEEIGEAIFYCCVEEQGQRNYYYFSEKELKNAYPIGEQCYDFDDHGVAKQVFCRGVLLADLLGSLNDAKGKPLCLGDEWQLQYLEKDAYHTNIPTYIDSLAAIGGWRRCLLALEQRQTYAESDYYHQDEADYQALAMPFIYRAAEAANESVLKNVLGILLRREAAPVVGGGSRLMLLRDGQEICPAQEIKGLLAGMMAAVHGPQIARHQLLFPAWQSLEIVPGAKADFHYQETALAELCLDDKRWPLYVSRLAGLAIIIPASPKEDSTRNLYIDLREQAGSPSPFGYDKLFLRRYEGWFLPELCRAAGFEPKLSYFLDRQGKRHIPKGEAKDYFLAFRHSQSKGVPNNTAVGRRVTFEYDWGRIISPFRGEIVVEQLKAIVLQPKSGGR